MWIVVSKDLIGYIVPFTIKWASSGIGRWWFSSCKLTDNFKGTANQYVKNNKKRNKSDNTNNLFFRSLLWRFQSVSNSTFNKLLTTRINALGLPTSFMFAPNNSSSGNWSTWLIRDSGKHSFSPPLLGTPSIIYGIIWSMRPWSINTCASWLTYVDWAELGEHIIIRYSETSSSLRNTDFKTPVPMSSLSRNTGRRYLLFSSYSLKISLGSL